MSHFVTFLIEQYRNLEKLKVTMPVLWATKQQQQQQRILWKKMFQKEKLAKQTKIKVIEFNPQTLELGPNVKL